MYVLEYYKAGESSPKRYLTGKQVELIKMLANVRIDNNFQEVYIINDNEFTIGWEPGNKDKHKKIKEPEQSSKRVEHH